MSAAQVIGATLRSRFEDERHNAAVYFRGSASVEPLETEGLEAPNAMTVDIFHKLVAQLRIASAGRGHMLGQFAKSGSMASVLRANISHRGGSKVMRTVIQLAVAAVSALVSSPSFADNVTEVVVQGTRNANVQVRLESPATRGAPKSKVFSLSEGVGTVGLDLATKAGAAGLERRVNDPALAVCREIGKQYPDSKPGDSECAKDAAKKAMVTVDKLVADAIVAAAHEGK